MGDERRASKKLKLTNPKAKSNVQEVGQRLVDQLHRASDKTGRLIATAFLELPPRDELPDYYDFTKLPVAVETIEEKLQNNDYPTLTTLESDFKRMVQNAKDYNAPKSEIYEDAERIRKLVYNYMKVHNPAYEEDPAYTSFPTPIPQGKGGAVSHDLDLKHKSPKATTAGSERPSRSSARGRSEAASERKVSIAPSATTGEVDDEDDDEEPEGDGGETDFNGKTFNEAQQLLIQEMLGHVDEEGLEIYSPFANLPSRKLDDYYKLIKHPVCLKSVAKRTRGQHGRNPATGMTDFKTWDQFEDEVSFIWRNAREYNEDGSDMYILAGEFEEHFKQRLADAKAKAEPPSGPKIKLGGPKPKVTLSLGAQHRDSPPGVSVDNDALTRQRNMVSAGANGGTPILNGTSRSTSQVPALDPSRPSSSAATGSPGIKNERMAANSPALPNIGAVPQMPNGMMPPPTARLPSGSPMPPQQTYTMPAPALLPPAPARTYPLTSALLPLVTLATHPQLKLPQPLTLSIPPHPTLAVQQTAFTLPPAYAYLQIAPTISKPLSMGRPYKLFVTLNGARLTQRDTQFHADTGRRTHVYEGVLVSGVNRVEVEVAAAKSDVGGADGLEGRGLDVEKVTAFVNLGK